MDLFNTGIRPAIDDHLLALSKQKRDYGEYWSASSAGYCQRKVIFERLGVPHAESEDDARRQRVFTAGHLFHAWAQGITKEAGLSIASEVELQDEDLMVRGHFDDLVLVGSQGRGEASPPATNEAKPQPAHLILYDYKTRNSRNFDYSKKPSYFHRLQLGTYMYMLRNTAQQLVNFMQQVKQDAVKYNRPIPELDEGHSKLVGTLTEARVLNIEKDTLRMSEVQYLWDTQLESDVLSYWNSLNTHWKAKTLPKCTCADHENGFMAKEKWNPYFYEGEPCSLKYYERWKAQ